MEGRRTEPLMLTMDISFDTEEEALRIGSSLRVDDDDFILTCVNGSTVHAEITGDTIQSIRRSADDWMACLMAAARSGRD